MAAFGTDDLTAISAAVSRGLFGDSPYRRGGSDRLGRAEDAPFPLHGWLTEVMEAPAPVPALLDDGSSNAGGFLMIRLAPVMQESTGSIAAPVMLGGLTVRLLQCCAEFFVAGHSVRFFVDIRPLSARRRGSFIRSRPQTGDRATRMP